jgi:hypothetical protein
MKQVAAGLPHSFSENARLEEENTCMSYEEEDTCMSYEEEDTYTQQVFLTRSPKTPAL